MSSKYDFSVEINFTETYKKHSNAHIAIREAICLGEMYPDILCKIEEGDLFAGRAKMSYIGFSPEAGGLGYYCRFSEIEKELQRNDYDPEMRQSIADLIEFWKTENTTYKVRKAFAPTTAKVLPDDDWNDNSGAAFPLYRMAGIYLDYEKLLKNGINGLKQIIEQRKVLAQSRGEDVELITGMEMVLDLLMKCCNFYAEMAAKLSASEHDDNRKKELQEMAHVLVKIASDKPSTFREAIQLVWLYTILSSSLNYGRMDVYLGDFLQNDLDEGIITEDEALRMLISLWRLMAERRTIWNGRVVIGGRGRRNEKHADRFAMLAMEATRQVKDIEPQLTLRFYKGMNPDLFNKALEVIGEGRTYPMLYNDDVNVDAVSKAFNVSIEEAEQYVPFGCGEYVIDHKSFGTPNGIINLLKVLEITLRNGRDALTGKVIGLETGEFKDFETFEQLVDAYKKQAEYFVDALAEAQETEYRAVSQEAPFLFLSMLYDDCIERGRGIFDGGIRYLGGTLESYGNTNTADSLTAIKELVFDRRLISREQLLAALDADFKGFEREKKLLTDAAKYGNDNNIADAMAIKVHEHICNAAKKQINRVNLHSYLVVVINNSANTTLGRWTATSADGRNNGKPMANANNPSGGSDKKGLTAMLNSLVKLRPDIHAGVVQNMKFSPELFKNNGAIVKSVLQTYFDKGGTQAMITVVNRDDLGKAMIEPEKYAHIFVRVGGFSARFIELEKDVQLEIISRTLY